MAKRNLTRMERRGRRRSPPEPESLIVDAPGAPSKAQRAKPLRAVCTLRTVAAMEVRELLEREALRCAGLRVLAGEDRLSEPVRWGHTGEIADIAQFLHGGEVLLTAATGLRGSEADRRRYIRELAAVGVAAVIIELGRAFRRVPVEMVEEARARSLVLVELQEETPFIAITQAVHTQLISSAHETLTRALRIDDALNRLILDG